ncbi:hypothetical protein VPNG_07253 [Cytospora leucostoma]|uniref:Uncharacterized protein n=1 Tax=Cytospora leucostoma TaxID=1230097 RepID=A0A423WKK9_9PEZI|nr:hypothetical protein VPNG_07253 [Cytospora leucostoma]
MPQATGRFYSFEATAERRINSRIGPSVPKSEKEQRKLLAELMEDTDHHARIAEIEKMDAVRVVWDARRGKHKWKPTKEKHPRGEKPPMSERKRDFLKMWLHTWETGAERHLPHDRDTLYGIAEQLSLWKEWFPGCKMVNILSTQWMIDKRSQKNRAVPKTILVLFGNTSLKLHVELNPGRSIELTSLQIRPGGEEALEKFELGWYFRKAADFSNTTANGAPALGTKVFFHVSARNYANTIRKYDEVWGQGAKEAAKQFIDGLEERASELQSRLPATESLSEPDRASKENNRPNLVRRQPSGPSRGHLKG